MVYKFLTMSIVLLRINKMSGYHVNQKEDSHETGTSVTGGSENAV